MSGTGPAQGGRGGLGGFLSGLVVAVGCVLFLGGFVWGAVEYRPYTVPTDSMTPTIKAGSRVLAQRISGASVHRGDVVIFRDPQWGEIPMVKRVVGVEGDTVACCAPDGRLTVDGRPIAEPYLAPAIGGRASTTAFDAKVPAGHLFLLGDERSSSLDSRVHLQDPGQGSVPRSEVTGRVDAVAWPLGSLVGRPSGFEALPGGVSPQGPVKLIAGSVLIGALLILAGAICGPLVRLISRPRRAARPREGVSGGVG